MLYYLNINFFGNHNGFNAILDRIPSFDEQNLSLLKHAISPISMVSKKKKKVIFVTKINLYLYFIFFFSVKIMLVYHF